MILAVVGLLGVVAGFLTTVSGMGGGLMLVISLSALWGPHVALPTTALALLVGNLHRLSLFRGHLRPDIARPLLVGMVPGSIVGSLLVVGMPAGLIHAVMLGLAAFALCRALLGWKWQIPRSALAPAGGAVGVMAGTSGGAAVLTAPLLLASGLRGDEYLATVALAAVAMHISRTIGYGAGGLVGADTFVWAGYLAVALVIGNLIGKRLRSHLPDALRTGLEYGVLAGCAALSVLGIG
ncbi:MAG TPA: sulfite exporter TauE/SafE family protein [Kofleriaceae bacterium]